MLGNDIINSSLSLADTSAILAHMELKGRSPIAEIYSLTGSLMPDRVAAEVGPTTLLMEYRRKIILQAINNSGNIPDDQLTSRKKLNYLIQTHYPDLAPKEETEVVISSDDSGNSTIARDSDVSNGILASVSNTSSKMNVGVKTRTRDIYKERTTIESSSALSSVKRQESSLLEENRSAGTLSGSVDANNRYRVRRESDNGSISSTSSLMLFPSSVKEGWCQGARKYKSAGSDWKTYDVMKRRWGELRPHLMDDNTEHLYLPQTGRERVSFHNVAGNFIKNSRGITKRNIPDSLPLSTVTKEVTSTLLSSKRYTRKAQLEGNKHSLIPMYERGGDGPRLFKLS